MTGEPTTLWRSALLTEIPGVMHGITRRVEGMGNAEGNVGFGPPRDRDDAWAMRQHWCGRTGLDAADLVTLGQVHGADVLLARASDAGRGAKPGSSQIGLGDALMSNEAGPVLMALHADCQPILFVDPGARRRRPAVAVAHAGWRGTVADVAGSTLATMAAAFGTRAEDVLVCLGPAIGACCYDVGHDVAATWCDRAGGDASVALEVAGDNYRFSLTAANTLMLHRAGVLPDHVESALVCTRCDGDHWFSHRGQGPGTGRFGAIIAIVNNGAHG